MELVIAIILICCLLPRLFRDGAKSASFNADRKKIDAWTDKYTNQEIEGQINKFMMDEENHDIIDAEVKKALEKMPSMRELKWDLPGNVGDQQIARDILLANRGLISYWQASSGCGVVIPGHYDSYELVDWIRNTLREQFIFVTPMCGRNRYDSYHQILFWEGSSAQGRMKDIQPLTRSVCDPPPKPTIPDPYYKR